jgi:ferrous iron transport protein B
MRCSDESVEAIPETEEQVLLVGNPNVGKSVLFSLLTNLYVTVSNYPGTTVSISHSRADLGFGPVTVIDSPGVNNLIPMSEDEQVTRDMLLARNSQRVCQVLDAKNLARGLLISIQLGEMGVPFVVACNMSDEASSRGIMTDTKALSETIGVDVVTTVAVQRKGVDGLKKGLASPRQAGLQVDYGPEIEEAVGEVEDLLPDIPLKKRSVALMLLAGDRTILPWIGTRVDGVTLKAIETVRQRLQASLGESVAYVINSARLKLAESIVEATQRREEKSRSSFAYKLGRLMVHPVWGLGFLAAVLYVTYKIVGEFGAGTSVDFVEEIIFGTYLNPWVTRLVDASIPVAFIKEMLVGQYGLITVGLTYALAIVLPIVGFFFLIFGILEDSGYLPRLAVMVNKLFRVVGLHGKAVLPMVLGLGCDTMATLTTRILDTKKERLITTLLLALAIPCSAQLGVILGMLGSLSALATFIWGGTLLGVLIVVGVLANFVLPGSSSDFVVELPPVRLPRLGNLAIKTLARIEWYLKEAVPLFILGTFILFVADQLNIIGAVERAASPIIVSWLGLPPEATTSFVMGFLRRDYGAAGLFALAKAGHLDAIQSLVALVTITLFIPCIANLFIIIKERGGRTAVAMCAFIFPFALLVGGVLNWLLRWMELAL